MVLCHGNEKDFVKAMRGTAVLLADYATTSVIHPMKNHGFFFSHDAELLLIQYINNIRNDDFFHCRVGAVVRVRLQSPICSCNTPIGFVSILQYIQSKSF
jgi:hypothetical protein